MHSPLQCNLQLLHPMIESVSLTINSGPKRPPPLQMPTASSECHLCLLGPTECDRSDRCCISGTLRPEETLHISAGSLGALASFHLNNCRLACCRMREHMEHLRPSKMSQPQLAWQLTADTWVSPAKARKKYTLDPHQNCQPVELWGK